VSSAHPLRRTSPTTVGPNPETRLTAANGRHAFAVSDTVEIDGVTVAAVTRHHEAAVAASPSSPTLAVVTATGEIDSDSSRLLLAALTEAIDGHPEVCCDLSRVSFFGAAGANTLLAADRHASTTGRRFSVRGVHGMTGWVLAVTGLDRILPIRR
jgi:anti-anti-sigma factor